MDEFVENYLMSWGFPNLVEVFKNHQVDEEAFSLLNEDLLKEIIPVIGIRAKFIKKYKEFLSQNNENPILLITEVVTSDSINSDNDDENKEYYKRQHYPTLGNLGAPANTKSVIELLGSVEKGKEIIESYKKLGKFCRSHLATLIIENELKNNPDQRITSERLKELAQQIAIALPGEFPESYYIPYCKKGGKTICAKGILWDKYVNKRRILRQIGILNPQPSTSSKANNIEETVEVIVKEVEDSALWLENNSHPWNSVKEHWENSYNVRQRLIKDGISIEDYLNRFQSLRQPYGYSLLELDFEKAYEEKSYLLLKKWPLVSAKIIQLAYSKQDKYLKAFLNKENIKTLSEHGKEVASILILPLLLPLLPLKSKKPGIHCRPSKEEMKDAFCIHIKDLSDLQPIITARRDKIKRHNCTPQPLTVIVGELNKITSSYVIIEDVTYELDTPLKALDVCFKAFHVLSVKYPCEADHVWLLLQKFVFELTTKFDSSYISVNTLISDLNNIH